MGPAILILFAAVTFATAMYTAIDVAKRPGVYYKVLSAAVLIFGILASFAIPAQILINQVNDKASSLQLVIDRELLKTSPDRLVIRREVSNLETLGKIEGLLRSVSFPDSLLPTETNAP